MTELEKVQLGHSEFTQLSSEILGEGHRLRFTAHGSSMAPFVRDGDVLTVLPVEGVKLKLGNIVFYRSGGASLIAHRIVGIEHNGENTLLRLRGDSSPGSEELVSQENILGLIASLERPEGERVQINQGNWARLGSLWVHLFPLPLIAYRMVKKIRSLFSRGVSPN